MTALSNQPVSPRTQIRIVLTAVLVGMFCVIVSASWAGAAERARIEAFLNITGFDVALDSIALSAGDAPQMLGVEPDSFGSDWARLTRDVFDTKVMRAIALDILEKTLSDQALGHAAAFYATDLGQRLVVAENATHMVDDDAEKQLKGSELVASMVADGSPRLELFKRMNRAIDASETGLRALQEIQIRFLLAASAAGVIDLQFDADQLRAFLKSQEGALRRAIQVSALAGSAYTYQTFSDADLETYVEALEEPDMVLVYELLNAVQYEIMANRFEVLAGRMANLHPGQDI